MHDHDLDLIAEYASGLLAEADASRAADLVRTCESCAREFADQQAIRSLLASAPAPTLSEFERTRLRRSVLDAASPPASATPWLLRLRPLIGVAAAMLVLVVGIGVVGNLGSTDGDLTLADGGESAATTAAASARVPMDEAEEAGNDTMSALSDADEDRTDAATADDSVAESSLPTRMIDAGDVAEISQLDPMLAELTAVIQESGEPLHPDDAVAFGATCAPSVEEELLGLVLARIDGVASQVFLVGDPAEPGLEIRLTADCSTPAP